MDVQIPRKPPQMERSLGEEEMLTPDQIAKRLHIHPSQARRMFKDEPGVIDVGLGGKYKTMRIPVRVYERVLRERSS